MQEPATVARIVRIESGMPGIVHQVGGIQLLEQVKLAYVLTPQQRHVYGLVSVQQGAELLGLLLGACQRLRRIKDNEHLEGSVRRRHNLARQGEGETRQ